SFSERGRGQTARGRDRPAIAAAIALCLGHPTCAGSLEERHHPPAGRPARSPATSTLKRLGVSGSSSKEFADSGRFWRGEDPGIMRPGSHEGTGPSDSCLLGFLISRRIRPSEPIVVALLDSGVNYTHPDLAANIWKNERETPNGKDDDGNGYVDDLHGW